MTAPMPETMTPREKVRQIIDDALNSAIPEPWEVANHATDRIFTALASGSVDHAELARLAEAATPGPWLYDRDGEEGSVWTRQPHTGELARTAPEDINGDFPAHDNAAFIAAANPATVLTLLAENAALRDREKAALKECSDWARKAGEAIGKLETSEAAGIVEGWRDRATEAERKLAEAAGLLREWIGTWFVDADSRGENAIADDTRKWLSKEAERDKL